MAENATLYAALFRNTFGTICDITFTNPFMMFQMLGTPVKLSSLEAGFLSIGDKCTYHVTVEKKTDTESELRYRIDGDSVFVIDFANKVFIQDQEVVIKTVRGKGAYINDCILAFNGPDGIRNAFQMIKTRFEGEIKQNIPTIVQYEGFDQMRASYRGQATADDIELEAMMQKYAPPAQN